MAKAKYSDANIQSFSDVVRALNQIIDVGGIGQKEAVVSTTVVDVSACGGSGVQKINLVTPNVESRIAKLTYSFATAFTACEYHIIVGASNTTDWATIDPIDKLTVVDCAAVVNTVVSVSPSVSARFSAATNLTINLSATCSANIIGNFTVIYDTWLD